jgi:hypothetical protein
MLTTGGFGAAQLAEPTATVDGKPLSAVCGVMTQRLLKARYRDLDGAGVARCERVENGVTFGAGATTVGRSGRFVVARTQLIRAGSMPSAVFVQLVHSRTGWLLNDIARSRSGLSRGLDVPAVVTVGRKPIESTLLQFGRELHPKVTGVFCRRPSKTGLAEWVCKMRLVSSRGVHGTRRDLVEVGARGDFSATPVGNGGYLVGCCIPVRQSDHQG